MKAVTILIVLFFAVGCRNAKVLHEGFAHAWPPGTVLAADQTNATHRVTLTFSIAGQITDQEHTYFFRVLDQPSDLTMSLPASGSNGDGPGGGFNLFVMPTPLSYFEDNRMSLDIDFSGTRDGVRTEVKESIEIPLFEERSGQVGSITYNTKWTTEPAN